MTEPRADSGADSGVDSGGERLARSLVEVAGADQVRAVLLFGSRLVQATPDRFSAYDLVLIVESYRKFYEALDRAGLSRRSPRIQAALNHVLAPNIIAFAPDGWSGGPVAKIMVLEPSAMERAIARRSPDHFVKGRLVQRVAVLHARDGNAGRWIEGLLGGARRDVLRWVGPYLEGSFTPADAALRMLQVSYRGEVRPEARDRVLDVFECQRAYLTAELASALAEAERAGQVAREGERYRVVRAAAGRTHARLYFARSKVRATARWLKHVVTFDNWLDYIARKVERRTGTRVEITDWERRLPYLLLWPKVFRVLRTRPQRRDTAAPADAGSRAPR